MVRNMFPDNIIASTFETQKTLVDYKTLMPPGQNGSIEIEQFVLEKIDGMNILGKCVQ